MIFPPGVRQFLALFLPSAILIVMGGALYGRAETRREISQSQSLQTVEVAGGADALRHSLRAVSADVAFLAALPRLHQAINEPSPANLAFLSANFIAFAETSGIYDQIRWLDETGMERVRVNYADGRAWAVPDSQLQNKADRYYFSEASRLGEGEIYLSSFDLNIERGEIETPLKPTLRLGAPLIDSAGRRHGVVVLNYLGRDLLDAFSEAGSRSESSLGLINQDGFWLKAEDSQDEWGFMFGRDDATMARKNPEAWQRIHSAAEGQMELSDGLWTWQTVFPSLQVARAPSRKAERREAAPGGERWTAVAHLPKARLDEVRRHIWGVLVPITALLTGLAGLACGFLARSRRRIALLNDDLARRVEEAEAANQAKARFLANMSHEIRTPMNAILGLAHLLENAELGANERDLVGKISISGKSLLGTINDILDLSKIEAGRLEIEHVPFRLSDVLDDLAAILATSVAVSDMELIIGPPPAEAQAVIGDALRLRQVLVNLASNAIKFTQAGEVAVQVALVSRADSLVTLRFSVSDTGVGIPPDQQAAIFAPFAQADSSTTRRFGGSGLGLTICHHLVAAMGGKIGVVSQPGQGSEFWFTVPLEIAADQPLAIPMMARLHLLIVDDNKMVRDILQATARSLNWTAEAVSCGEVAVARLRASDGETKFCDVVLIDWAMPGLDGLATARAIRQIDMPSRRSLILIMVAPFARAEVVESLAAQQGGVDGLVTKPVTGSSLYDAVGRALRWRDGGLAAAAQDEQMPPRGRRLAGLRLLVVDDNEINREVARRILEVEGATVALAGDGAVALAYLAERPDKVDVVLMDIQMPVMDGYEACRRIRADLGLAGLPVIALTAGALSSEREAALQAGMNDFIPKPIDVNRMIAVLRRINWTPPLASSADGKIVSPIGAGAPGDVVRAAAAAAAGMTGELLHALKRALDNSDPGTARSLLAALAGHLPADQLSLLVELIGASDLVGARALAADLAIRHGMGAVWEGGE
ncbi:hybrid sensor histidine kinase/response regulator [Telmatospirillum siberiense]|nr:response regulator [Telmatospirillum siberiense]